MKPFSILLLISFSVKVFAIASSVPEFKGNWAERFSLRSGGYIEHTEQYVNLDGFIFSGKEMHITGKSYNGIPMSSCGLHLKTNSTREEFIEALRCSGLF